MKIGKNTPIYKRFMLYQWIFSYFCAVKKNYKHTMIRNIPTVTKNLLIINIVAFLVSCVLSDLNSSFGLHFFLADDFHLFQFVTYMFMHGNFYHILMNMFMLWMFGTVIERVWGSQKFLVFYFVCGLGAACCQEVAQFFEIFLEARSQFSDFGLTDMFSLGLPHSGVTVGASGAIYGVLLAFGMLFPNERMFIIPIPFPIKAKWLITGSVVIELLSAMGTSNDGVAHLAHLGGMLFGFIMIKYWQRHPYAGDGNFGSSQGRQFFDRMRDSWERRRGTSQRWTQNTTQRESDWDYNARKQREQDEIDRILDKIRKSGYDSLSKDEKLKLFNQSNKH